MVAAVAVYQRLEDRVVFVHTEVDDAFEGQGVGSLLVRRRSTRCGARGCGSSRSARS